MADKKQSKGYKAGNGKKWLFGFGAIAIIAIVIVLIVISLPPNTDKAMELLNKASTNSFLMSTTERTNYDQFEQKVADSPKINSYMNTMPQEMADVQTLSMTLADVLEFYNDYMLFAKDNSELKKNYKSIKGGLEDAMKNQQNLNALLIKVKNNLSENSSTYLQNAWVDFRSEYVGWLGNYYKAVSALNNAFIGSMGNVTTNSLASKTILDTTTDFVKVLYNDFKEIAQKDAKNPNASSYNYTLKGKITAFDDFVDYYLVNDSEIKNYYFNSAIKDKFEKINSYFHLYGEDDMTNAIDSIEYISNRAVVTKTYTDVEDSENVYAEVKVFLMGGI